MIQKGKRMIKLIYEDDSNMTAINKISVELDSESQIDEVVDACDRFIRMIGYYPKDNHTLEYVPELEESVETSRENSETYSFNLGDVEDPHLYAQIEIDTWQANVGVRATDYELKPNIYGGYEVTVNYENE